MKLTTKSLLGVSVIVLLIVALVACGMKLADDVNKPSDSETESVADSVKSDTDKLILSPTPEPGKPSDEPTPTPTCEPTPTPKPYTVVLDPGHGGKDPGACSDGLVEATLTLKIAEYCRDYLLNNYDSIEVYLTRTEDVHLSSDKVEDLRMRCEVARDTGADCLVSIHLNASDAHKLRGAEIYYSRRENVGETTLALSNAIMDELEALGIKKREVRTRRSNDMFDDKGVALDYYAINRHCAEFGIPGIIVEAGFMDNTYDREFLLTDEGLKSIGEADARGIVRYLGADIVN